MLVTQGILVVALLGQLATSDRSADQRLVEGLLDRRLFDLAELHCREELARGEIDSRRRETLALALLRTLGERARHASPDERPTRWNETQRAAEELLAKSPLGPRLVLIEIQAALLSLAEGEIALEERRLLGGDENATDATLRPLRRATQGLERARETIARLQRGQGRGGAGEATLSAEELTGLDQNVRYQLARAYRATAHSYPPGSADWINSLSLALEQLGPIAELAAPDATVWRARLERTICLRGLGKHREAAEALDALEAPGPPPSIALAARAEQIRLALDAGQPDRAAKAIGLGRTLAGQSSAELDLARLEWEIHGLRQAKQASAADEIARRQRTAAEQVRSIEREHGPYWMRRAETLLAGDVVGAAGGDASTLRLAAESLYRGGRIDDALAAYDRAVAEANEAGQADLACDLAFAAATIQHDRQAHVDAARRYQELAERWPRNPRAPQAHLLAIVNLAAQLRTAPSGERETLLPKYSERLAAHLRLWPGDPTADRARLWQADLARSRHDWPAAIAAYRGCQSAEQAEVAARGAMECFSRWLDQQRGAGGARDAIAVEAIGFLDGLIVGQDRKWPDQFTPLQRDAALASAKIRLADRKDAFAEAERLLREALARSTEAPDDWRSEARLLLVYALAAQGNRTEATKVLDDVAAGSADILLSMVEALGALPATGDATVRRELGDLMLGLAKRLEPRRGELSADGKRLLDHVTARALVDTGRRADALTLLEKLARQYPRDGAIQITLLDLLSQTEDRPTLERALAGWRDVESKTRRGSDRWFHARYAQAEALYRLGRTGDAAKLVELTRVLHPDLGGDELRAKFDRLGEAASR